MQGINKAKHVHLVDALLQMQRLLSRGQPDSEAVLQTTQYRAELETMHNNYECLLMELAEQIYAYEALFSQVKINFLGKKLKELKKEIPVEQPAFVMLVENIRLAYGT